MTIITRAAVAVVATLLAAAAAAAGAYNFSYRSSGEAELRPIQVFDDGTDTYVQMRSANLVPTIFADTENGQQLVQSGRTGAYLVIPVVTNRLTIRFGQLEAKILYTGAPRKTNFAYRMPVPESATPTPGAVAGDRPKPNASSYGVVRPMVGDSGDEFIERESLVGFARGKATVNRDAAAKLLLALAGSGTIARVLIVGRDDANYVEGLAKARAIAIRERVLAAGVDLDKIVMKEGIARDGETGTVTSDIVVVWKTPSQLAAKTAVALKQQVKAAPATAEGPTKADPPVQRNWEMLRSDQTVALMLKRWGTIAGWDVVWEAKDSVPISGDAIITAENFLVAADTVINQSNRSGYHLDAQAFSNKVLVIK